MDADGQADGKKNTDTLRDRYRARRVINLTVFRKKKMRKRDTFNQGFLKLLIKTYRKKDHFKTLSIKKKYDCVCWGWGQCLSLCVCVSINLSPSATKFLQTASIVNNQNKDDSFCPSSDCLSPPSHPFCLFFLCQSEISIHRMGKISLKALAVYCL